jgi:hypothetical protein
MTGFSENLLSTEHMNLWAFVCKKARTEDLALSRYAYRTAEQRRNDVRPFL